MTLSHRHTPLLGLTWMLAVEMGAMQHGLPPCPDSPNCVSSESNNSRHRITPLRYRGSKEEAFQRLKGIILDLPRTRLVEEEGNYLHFEFHSLLFGFVDDVEFYVRPDDAELDVRSASRTGYWDLGVNRRRIEEIRAAFDNTAEAS